MVKKGDLVRNGPTAASGNLARAAGRAVGSAVRAGAASYDRTRDLPALIRIDPFSPIPETREGVERIVARLKSALRAERNRACSGHWTYDLNRHIALHQACSAETERLAALKRAECGRPAAKAAS